MKYVSKVWKESLSDEEIIEALHVEDGKAVLPEWMLHHLIVGYKEAKRTVWVFMFLSFVFVLLWFFQTVIL